MQTSEREPRLRKVVSARPKEIERKGSGNEWDKNDGRLDLDLKKLGFRRRFVIGIQRQMQPAFIQWEFGQPHPARARALMEAHPEVRQLIVLNPYMAIIAVSVFLLRALAPEFYDTVNSHTSWSGLLFQLTFGRRYTVFSRVERFQEPHSVEARAMDFGIT